MELALGLHWAPKATPTRRSRVPQERRKVADLGGLCLSQAQGTSVLSSPDNLKAICVLTVASPPATLFFEPKQAWGDHVDVWHVRAVGQIGTQIKCIPLCYAHCASQGSSGLVQAPILHACFCTSMAWQHDAPGGMAPLLAISGSCNILMHIDAY
jgi:hypothetical protein